MKNVCLFLLLWMTGSVSQAAPVHLKKARQIAGSYMKRTLQMRNLSVSRPLTEGVDETEVFEPLYVFNRGQNEGFVIVSGDDCLPEVLGYTDSGDFVKEEMPPALLDMLEAYKATVNCLRESGRTLPPASPRVVEGRTDIAPLIRTHWHQSEPYNNLCPMLANGNGRSITGCTATAASQIIYYWHKDCNDRSLYATPTYSYGDAPVTESVPGGTPLKWDLMQLSYGSSYPAEMGNAVAMLMLITGTTLWQTYGSSTSGELQKLPNVFSSQYGLNAAHVVKSGYSTSSWEKMIYDDLAEGHPIEYAGSHPTNGGHAIVLDGYKASNNMFHFNFGWGGQGDGYYTLDDADGVGGFSQYQHMVYKITPKKLNLSAKIITERLVRSTTNTIRVQFTNNSTLPYSGVYLFCLTGNNKPSAISKATRSNVKTVVPTGQTVNVDFEYNPTSALDYTIYVVDKNNTVLAQKTLASDVSVPDLTLQAFGVNTNGETTVETIKENGKEVQKEFSIVQNTDAQVKALLYNGKKGSYCEPGVRCFLYAYNAETGGFDQLKSSTHKATGFGTDDAQAITYSFTRLDESKLYKASLSDIITNNLDYTIDCSKADTVVYFRVTASTLAVASSENGEMKLEGKWNADAFAKLSSDVSVCRYDLTGVEGLNEQPLAANKNALFYVSDEAKVEGNNIIRSGVCDNLLLETGYDFQPREDFKAVRATYIHNRPAAQWNTLVLPFDCEVPDGIMARRVKKLFLSYIYECDSVNLSLKSGTPYLYVAGAPCHDRFAASDVTVSVNVPSESTDSVRGTFVNLPAVKGMYVLSDGTGQSFNAVSDGTTVAAFTAYLQYGKAVGVTSYIYKSKDQLTIAIAQKLTEAYELLEKNGPLASAEATEVFKAAIAVAEEALHSQPEYADMRAAQRELTDAMEVYSLAYIPEEGGERNMTAFLTNPSFEAGNLNGWEVVSGTAGKPTVSRTTSSLANYMSGADGTYVLYAPMSGGSSAEVRQTVEGLENGTYKVMALVASDTGNRVELFANACSAQAEIDDFGPMYLHEVTVESIPVTDGTLTFGVRCEGGWYKADHFRLYRQDAQATAVGRVTETPDELYVQAGSGCIRLTSAHARKVTVCDLSGRIVAVRTVKGTQTIGGLPAGTYIVNRHKVMVF
ncbi:MAG: C10 family peptidase [Paraprevotella sp.]|nr:C10 family peptidase [Paraprevotella sp.]